MGKNAEEKKKSRKNESKLIVGFNPWIYLRIMCARVERNEQQQQRMCINRKYLATLSRNMKMYIDLFSFNGSSKLIFIRCYCCL